MKGGVGSQTCRERVWMLTRDAPSLFSIAATAASSLRQADTSSSAASRSSEQRVKESSVAPFVFRVMSRADGDAH